ncbi:M24 family metallopeptidase [Mycoplasma tauri]|uniref:Aminopeptidase P family protein n=1 Tax=Mycoplasma tauri TaxID=547987 RepID=A0A953T4S7_9MOLU|nr:M24 family metallopeptidase [Mycoplasma tauri]MBZ4195300.1 aminopeptidase P family protein [Mycoplasma tauri]MBZ4203836.1 aminopeptidase P family protein [Mycoplasma tauri]MBZ4204040.1 aminopeptidase P family protein [Mycoplasma tauri]MBZ4212875.1 aminopeptidase P family protein [Mycoplasma tauri]MBZ4218311.1 aminopeptidase P family protein [Mycoplasma tauri]
MYRSRLDKLFNEMHIDCIVSDAPQTRLWYAGVQTTDGYIVIEKDKAYLFVDSRYIEYCSKYAKNVEIILLKGNSLSDFFDKKAYKNVVFEKDYISYEVFHNLTNIIKPKQIGWIRGQELRIQKSNDEIQKMQEVVNISLKAYNKLIKIIKPGMTEKETAAKLNYLLKECGADKESFEEIVATGPNSAEPHHHPTDAILVEGDLLKIDFGALYKGYSADITRTIILGGTKKSNNPEQQKILSIVEEAARLGRKAIRPGIKAGDIDKICRDYIQNKGYGDYFVHSTGHGLGIDVHELPNVRPNGDYILQPGMVITVEPGIYIPGVGGARIEDDVLVTQDGYYVFSRPDESPLK